MELELADLPEGVEVLTGEHLDGPRLQVKFPNGYGASVVNHWGSHGTELAVLKFGDGDDWEIAYDTPVTSDVIGHIESRAELLGYLEQIAELPRKYEFTSGRVRFEWTGGPYIQMFWDDEYRGDPFAVINVYDYAAGHVTISGQAEFEGACRSWIDELEPGELDNYRQHT